MALTYAQIILRAGQDAKVPGFVDQAGEHLNMVLQDLALNYDFDIKQNNTFTITTGSVIPPEGPYPLPADYLRHVPDQILFVINGFHYSLHQKSYAAYKQYFTGQGIGNYPEFFATNMGTPGNSEAFMWPPPNGVYVIQWPYYEAHTYESDPANSTNVPWFPVSSYLIKETAARLCSGNDDDRSEKLAAEAEKYLTRYLKMKDDQEGYVNTVGLDRNNFPGRGRLKGTKQNPWGD